MYNIYIYMNATIDESLIGYTDIIIYYMGIIVWKYRAMASLPWLDC